MFRQLIPDRWWHRQPASANYQILTEPYQPELLLGWSKAEVATRQQAAFAPLLRQMRAGQPRADFVALAQALAFTKLTAPLIIEIGCGSGWNCEVLKWLWGAPFRYVGLDVSPAMIALARQNYRQPFAVGDALRLPVRDAGCDVLMSGTVLMHLPEYAAAIRESRRATRQWCLFHTVPLLQRRPTTFLSKLAYGEPTFEVIFNEGELVELFQRCRLAVRASFPSLQYDLAAVLGESTATKTFLCEALGA